MAAGGRSDNVEQNQLFERLSLTFLSPIDFHDEYIVRKREIGKGAFGTVCKVKNRQTGKLGAMKTLTLDREKQASKNLKSEVMTLVELRSNENIVKVFDMFMGVDNQLHLVMELCDGDLADHMCSEDNHEMLSLLDIAQQVANGLDALHSHKPTIVHRDMKPPNILIKRKSVTHKLVAKIADFGISRRAEAGCVLTDNLVGTPPYTAPESFLSNDGIGLKDGKNPVSASEDIFALGLVYVYMFCYKDNYYGTYGA